MKKSAFPLFCSLCLCCLWLFTGCLKDKCSRTLRIYYPVYNTLSQVRSEMKSDQPEEVSQPGKIYVYGQYLFLNEVNKGIHVFDNSNPAQPKNVSFIKVPGNVDLAVKGDFLYADSYSDLVVFDISTPTNVTAKKFVNNVFPDRAYYYQGRSSNPDSVNVLVAYAEKDTVVDCSRYRSWSNSPTSAVLDSRGGQFFVTAAAAPMIGTGGSMARFTLAGNFLYTVSTSQLFAFNVSNAAEPQLANTKKLGWGIETIYPFRDKLFIGSNSGMFIYDISTNEADPVQLGQFSHVRSCDPVVADDQNAFVTLRSGTACQGFTNQLEVLNITNLTQPVLLKTYPMTNPHGLAKDNALLFICDGKDGLKVYNASDVNNLQLLKTVGGMDTYDVIAYNGLAIVVARDGLYQFSYSNNTSSPGVSQISKISLSK